MNPGEKLRVSPAGHWDPQQASASQPGGNRDKKGPLFPEEEPLSCFWVIPVRLGPLGCKSRKKDGAVLVGRRLDDAREGRVWDSKPGCCFWQAVPASLLPSLEVFGVKKQPWRTTGVLWEVMGML